MPYRRATFIDPDERPEPEVSDTELLRALFEQQRTVNRRLRALTDEIVALRPTLKS